jgi:hypothetical protein
MGPYFSCLLSRALVDLRTFVAGAIVGGWQTRRERGTRSSSRPRAEPSLR